MLPFFICTEPLWRVSVAGHIPQGGPDADGGGGVEYNSRGYLWAFSFLKSRKQRFNGAFFDLYLYFILLPHAFR